MQFFPVGKTNLQEKLLFPHYRYETPRSSLKPKVIKARCKKGFLFPRQGEQWVQVTGSIPRDFLGSLVGLESHSHKLGAGSDEVQGLELLWKTTGAVNLHIPRNSWDPAASL